MINGKTKICCAIGNPIEHSLSPIMHNAAYKSLGLNYAYVTFRIENIKAAVIGFKALGITGISVTVPHKMSIMPFIDEIEKIAKDIGAVNTVFNNNGKLIGSNTDYIGAIRALEEKVSLNNKNVALIGSGGAARAIAFGLKQKGTKILILNRTLNKAKELALEVKSAYGDLQDLSQIASCDILINATSVGMSPNINESIIKKENLAKNMVIFDIVYNPKETKLIKDAKAVGCEIVYGYKMLLYQAIGQFELFTGHDAPVEVMEKALVEELERRTK